jgi:type II secretory pathway pseudopilin PulG
MSFYRKWVGRGVFSMLELAVVLVVLTVVGSIVGPRMSRAAAHPTDPSRQLLIGRLKSLRTAIAAYAADHAGRYPDGDADQVTKQLTQYSDQAGVCNPSRTVRYHCGPYLREIPELPLGEKRGQSTLRVIGTVLGPPAGWVYDPQTAQIRAATLENERDGDGREYASY